MAIVEDGLLKGARGRIGNFIFYQCQGKTYVREIGKAKERKFSSGALEQQERFSSVVMLYQAVKAANLYKYWQKAAKRSTLSGYNLFVQHHLPAFTGDGIISDFNKLQLTVGKLQYPNGMALTYDGNGVWTMTWRNNYPYPGVSDDDRLVVAFMKREDVFTIKIPDIGDYHRRDCRATIRRPESLQEYTHLYCYFYSATSDEATVSRYFQLIT